MQTSCAWDGVAIGDASRARYDADEWSEVWQDMFNSDLNRGVLRNRGLELVRVLPGDNQFRIRSGAALVRGRWYNNNADVNFVPLNAIATWRRDRIVLSCTWADINDANREPQIQTAQTIRLIRLINPVDGGPPDMEKTDGVLWEIPLYTIETDNLGAVTVYSDDREFLLADTAAAGLYDAYVYVRDEKAQGTNGGAFNQGAWRRRDLTDEIDPAGICTLAANQITLAAGTYRCIISAPAYLVDSHQTRLQNVTGGVTLLIGTTERASAGVFVQSRSFIVGRFTVAVGQALEVQHYCSNTDALGFGNACNFTDEIYTVAEFWRES